MNKRFENRLTMYEGLLTLLQANSTKVQSVGGFADAVTAFAGVVTAIKAKSTEVDGATAGKAASKYNAEDALVDALIPIASALYMHGRKQGNAELTERTKITEGKLRAMRDTELAKYGSVIGDLATANAAGIATFGISAEKITDLKGKATAYNTAIGARESSIAERKGARGTMSELFDKADEMLNEEFDHFMELLRPTDTELYNKYFSARIVKDTGYRTKPNGEPAPAPAPAGLGK